MDTKTKPKKLDDSKVPESIPVDPQLDVLLKIYEALVRIETQLKTEVVIRDKYR